MLAEIFLLKVEAQAREARAAARFVPVILPVPPQVFERPESGTKGRQKGPLD
jgi:hypothetical protein